MVRFYKGVTYDVCEHNNLYEHMSEYPLNSNIDIYQQVKELAERDVAPLVKLYESEESDFTEMQVSKEYWFKEYECACAVIRDREDN